MSAVFKREFCSYTHSMMGYIFIALFLLFTGISVVYYNFHLGSTEIQSSLSNLTIFGSLLLPLITADLFCKEKRQKTDALLTSLPIRTHEVVLGKCLAALCTLALPMPVIVALPLIFNFFGQVNFLASYGAIVAYMLFNAAIIAVLIFVASVSKNYVMSLILSYVSLIVLYILSLPSAFFQNGTFLRSIFDTFSIFTQFNNFVYGLFDISVLLFYLSFAAIFILLTIFYLQRAQAKKGEGK